MNIIDGWKRNMRPRKHGLKKGTGAFLCKEGKKYLFSFKVLAQTEITKKNNERNENLIIKMC